MKKKKKEKDQGKHNAPWITSAQEKKLKN